MDENKRLQAEIRMMSEYLLALMDRESDFPVMTTSGLSRVRDDLKLVMAEALQAKDGILGRANAKRQVEEILGDLCAE